MIELAILAIIAWIFYYLFIKGNAYPVIFFIFGVYGGKLIIEEYIPSSQDTIMTFMSYDISYSAFIATIISILAIGVIMEKIGD